MDGTGRDECILLTVVRKTGYRGKRGGNIAAEGAQKEEMVVGKC